MQVSAMISGGSTTSNAAFPEARVHQRVRIGSYDYRVLIDCKLEKPRPSSQSEYMILKLNDLT